MKHIHFEGSVMLAGLSNMLECCGHNTEDYRIALDMHAPWLFLQEEGRFIAGRGLYTPRWLNLYLRPHGFRLVENQLPKADVPAFLRLHQPAMLALRTERDARRPAVCTAYESSRYSLTNVKTAASAEPDQLSLSRPMLLRRLEDNVRVFTLENCSPETVDFVPLLVETLQTLRGYERAMMEACMRTITREELEAMRAPLLRALLTDMLPMALLLRQPTLYEELRLLQHDYRHIFTLNSPETVNLWERLPRSAIRRCIAWMRENVVDQLYEHGLTEAQVEAALADAKRR